MPQMFLTLRGPRWIAVTAVIAVMLAAPSTAAAQSAPVRYQRAVAREQAARSTTAPPLATLRAIAKAYESVARAYPRSGYADNALWQAASVMTLAYERSGSRQDREEAARLLAWLKREYPKAPLAKQVDTKLAALRAPARKPVAAAAPASPAPPIPAPAALSSTALTPVSTAAGRTAASPVTSAPVAAAAVTSAPQTAPAATRPPGAVTTAPVTAPRSAPVPAGPRTGALAGTTAASTTAATPVVSVPLAPPAFPHAVRNITHSALPKGDRLTIELTGEATFAASRAANPDRVVLDLTNAGTATAVAQRAAEISGTLVRSLTVGRSPNDATRLIVEVAGNARYSTFPLYNPFRLVVDVEADGEPAVVSEAPAAPSFIAKSTSTPSLIGRSADPALPRAPAATPPANLPVIPAPAVPAITSRGDFSLARQLGLSVSRIVIDPGHGGHDPGAQANGISEAELVLDIASRLAVLLKKQPGFDVVLTRERDEFIALEERTAMANRAAADMFISIHANASPQASTRGIETFFLDFATTPQAEALAARENASSAQAMRLLPELVKTIALTNKLDESRELARAVQTSLVRKLGGPSKSLRDLGVKRAPFVVLIGAQMPSVLAEISFLTNRSDAALLKQNAYRQRIAQALFDAVLKYQTSLKTTPSVVGKTAAN